MTATTTSKRKSTAQARRILLSLELAGEHRRERGNAAERSVERILLEHFWRSPRRLAE